MVLFYPKLPWIFIISIAILSSDCRSLKIDDSKYMNVMQEMEIVAPSSKFCKYYKDYSPLTWILCHVFDHDSGIIIHICEFDSYLVKYYFHLTGKLYFSQFILKKGQSTIMEDS